MNLGLFAKDQSDDFPDHGKMSIYTFINTFYLLITEKMVNKKAQSSMEFLILMGFLTFVMVVIIGAGFYYSNTINDRMKSSQIANFANKITSTAEVVFYAGEPSKATITAHLPDGVTDLQIIENSIVITHSLTSGENTIAYQSSVPMVENFSAELSIFSGIKSIVIVANESHAVVSRN